MSACRALTARALVFAVVTVLASTSSQAAGRELAAPVADFVEVEVATVGWSGPRRTPVVLLRAPQRGELIPIFIGADTARAILQALRGSELPRPMTHDLLADVIGSLDARLARVYVDAIVDNTFLGMLELERAGSDQATRIDTRPSDAIALALRAGASIYVAPKVLERARLIDYHGLADQRQVVTALGLTVMAATSDLREALELPARDGVVVTEASAAARGAGIEAGALLLAIDGAAATTPMEFLRRVRASPQAETVAIRYWQGGAVRETELPRREPDEGGPAL